MTLTPLSATKLEQKPISFLVTTGENSIAMHRLLLMPTPRLLTFASIVEKKITALMSADTAGKLNASSVTVRATRANFVICIWVEEMAKRNGQAILKVVPIPHEKC